MKNWLVGRVTRALLTKIEAAQPGALVTSSDFRETSYKVALTWLNRNGNVVERLLVHMALKKYRARCAQSEEEQVHEQLIKGLICGDEKAMVNPLSDQQKLFQAMQAQVLAQAQMNAQKNAYQYGSAVSAEAYRQAVAFDPAKL